MKTFTVIDKTTGKYPDVENIALHEEWAKGLIYCDIDSFVVSEDGILMLTDECGNVAYCPADRFEVIFEDEIWYSVNEKLPNECEDVIVTDGEYYAIGTYREDAHAWEHWCYGWLERDREDECPTRLGKVTHWRKFTPMNKDME